MSKVKRTLGKEKVGQYLDELISMAFVPISRATEIRKAVNNSGISIEYSASRDLSGNNFYKHELLLVLQRTKTFFTQGDAGMMSHTAEANKDDAIVKYIDKNKRLFESDERVRPSSGEQFIGR